MNRIPDPVIIAVSRPLTTLSRYRMACCWEPMESRTMKENVSGLLHRLPASRARTNSVWTELTAQDMSTGMESAKVSTVVSAFMLIEGRGVPLNFAFNESMEYSAEARGVL